MKNEIRTVVLFNYRKQKFANLVSKNGARIHVSQVILPHRFVRLLAFMKLDFETAAKFNPVFTYAIFPLCVFLMLQDAVAIIVRAVFKRNCPSILENGMFAFKYFF